MPSIFFRAEVASPIDLKLAKPNLVAELGFPLTDTLINSPLRANRAVSLSSSTAESMLDINKWLVGTSELFFFLSFLLSFP